MRKSPVTFMLFLSLLLTISLFITPAAAVEKQSAVKPAHRHNWWTIRHQQVLERVKQGDIDLIFIGDSITHRWEKNGLEIWKKYYQNRKAVNMGFSCDRTQHILWRLENGEIDAISPKVAVVMIGTNNTPFSRNYTVEETADGVTAICKKLRARLPETKILLLAILPREQQPGPLREKIAKINKIIAKLDDGKMIHYLDIGDRFLEPDKSLSKEIMLDYLHLTHEGYQIWAEAMEPKLAELLGEKKAEHQAKLIIDADALKPIEPIAGSLVIVGGGKVPDVIWQRFMKLAGGKNAHVVVIPTASKEADTLDLDEYLKKWRDRNPASVTILHTRSKEDANDPNFVKPLEKATAIWFGGGGQSRIADAYLGTLAEKKFHEVLKRGGVIGGTSAGAAIMSRTMIARGHPKPEIETGLGFIPGAIIDQHFIKRQRQVRLVDAVTSYPYLVGLGIDEGTALVVHDGSKIDVLGDSCVTVIFGPHGNYPIKIEKNYPKKQTDNKPNYIADLIKLTRLAQDRCQPTDSLSR